MSTIFPPALECTGMVELSFSVSLFVILVDVKGLPKDDDKNDEDGSEFNIVDILVFPFFSETMDVLGVLKVKPCCDEVDGSHHMVEVYSPCGLDDVSIVARLFSELFVVSVMSLPVVERIGVLE